MPLKAVTNILPKTTTITPSTAATALGLGKDTSIVDTNLQIVIVGQLQAIVDQLQTNNRVLNEKLNSIGMAKVKLLSIKRFLGDRLKLKGFLI